MLRERIVHTLIGTPLQRPLEDVRCLLGRWRSPDLPELLLEPKRIVQLLEQTIDDGMNCIDVGCHLGSTLNEIVRFSPHGHHIALEPLPYKAEWLRRKYPNVQIHQVALGEKNGRVEFQWNTRRSGYSSLKGPDNEEGVQMLEVDTRRLDDLVSERQTIGFMKVDVEGAELFVFQGARRVFAESRPIVLFECTQSGTSRFGITAARMFEFITTELDYQIYLIKDWLARLSPLELPQFETAMKYPFQAVNFVAAPRS